MDEKIEEINKERDSNKKSKKIDDPREEIIFDVNP
jgi:hypothetical protein